MALWAWDWLGKRIGTKDKGGRQCVDQIRKGEIRKRVGGEVGSRRRVSSGGRFVLFPTNSFPTTNAYFGRDVRYVTPFFLVALGVFGWGMQWDLKAGQRRTVHSSVRNSDQKGCRKGGWKKEGKWESLGRAF